jgi:transcriptional regulator with XRE-family HTH domain
MNYEAWRDQQLSERPDLREAYDALEPAYAFRNALTRARLERGLTQAKLAEVAGMQRAAIARLESGDVNPTLSTLARLARALGMSIEVTPDDGVHVHDRIVAD